MSTSYISLKLLSSVQFNNLEKQETTLKHHLYNKDYHFFEDIKKVVLQKNKVRIERKKPPKNYNECKCRTWDY